MKLNLINVSVHKALNFGMKKRGKAANYPALGLITLAAVTKPDIEVSITEDEHEEIDYDGADLVGLSFLTPAAYRAYEIADRFRKNNVRVVLGGVHVSAMPDEAALHADAIVLGEAEGVWKELIEDFGRGSLRKVYKETSLFDLARLPMARRDLLKRKYYASTNVIQASRGCPFNCEFCSVGDLFGRSTRFRPVKNVIEEIRTMDRQILVFTDDNLAINKNYSRELFTSLKPLKREWVGEASWTMGHMPDLLHLARESGCRGLLIGFESIQEQEHVRKVSRYKDMRQAYMESINNFHKHGIAVVGAFVFGFDNDREGIFDDTLNFALESDVDILELNTLIPYPGTPLYARLKKEGRISTDDWKQYTYYPPGLCFEPRHMSSGTVKKNLGRIYRKFYSFKSMIPRLFRVGRRYRDIRAFLFLAAVYILFRKRIHHGYKK